MVNGHRKERTAQQKTGEAMIKYILDEVDGECYSFQYVSELHIRGGVDDNAKIIFLISQQKHTL